MKELYKIYKKLINCILLLLFIILVAFLIKLYFKPFFVIIILVFLCKPINNFLCKHKVFSKKLNACISLIFVNLLIIMLIISIGNYLINQIYLFINSDLASTELILKKISALFNINFEALNNKITSYYSNIMNSDLLKRGAVYTTDGLFTYFIGNIAAYFILVDKYVILNWIGAFIPKEKIYNILDKANDLKKIVRIELILVCITTFETIFGFLALHIDDAVLLGLICGILDLLPYVGTIFVFLPLIIYKLLIKDYIIGAGLIILYLLLIISRQVMEARFISNKLQIHPLLIIISLYIGIKVFGFIGLFIGPIYIISAKQILVEYS